MATYLALIIDNATGKEVDEYQYKADSDYLAMSKAERHFQRQQQYRPRLRKVRDWRAEVVAL